jgi:hypothetical protein
LADLSRQVNGQLDTRIARLDLLLVEADRKIKMLQELTGPAAAQQAKGWEVSDNGPTSVSDSQERPMDGFVSEANREIVTLADQGLTATAIAQKLGRPVGEIELILSLVRKKR